MRAETRHRIRQLETLGFVWHRAGRLRDRVTGRWIRGLLFRWP